MDALQANVFPGLTRLMPPGSRVIVGTSGGPDSQVLLHLLAELRHRLQLAELRAVGVDHGLRSGAAQELALAHDLATRLGVPFEVRRVQLPAAGNVLANARQVRYAALHAAMRRHGGTRLAVAHTASDQVEGIVMNLCRGATLRGAAGMRCQRGALVRPLLQIPRGRILEYVQVHQLEHALDPSNQDLRRARPRLRRALPELLHSINPRYAEHVASFAEQAQEDAQYLQARAARRLSRHGGTARPLDMAQLAVAPAALGRRMLYHWVAAQGAGPLAPAVLQTLWSLRHDGRAHGQWPLQQAKLRLERGLLWCERTVPHGDHDLPVPGKQAIPGFQAQMIIESVQGGGSQAGHFARPEAQGVAFDADRLHFGLKLRAWHPGDRIRPFGLDGSIKVGNVFTNAKIPRALRGRWPIITHGAEVLWVVGLRRGQGAAVEQKTKRIITLKLDKALLESAC